MTNSKEIAQYLSELLETSSFEDTSNNGLQVENEGQVQKVAFAVDACLETFQKAKEQGCQMLITHHGLIWEGIKYIKGNTYQKIKHLITNNLALYTSHLPLDAHPQYGNNTQLAQLLHLQEQKPFGFYKDKMIGCMGTTDTTLEQIKMLLRQHNMKTTTLPFGPQQIKKIALISGGAAAEVVQAMKVKADLYITGEPLHYLHHLAKENNINVIFAGHYETEVWGVKALMPLIKEKFSVETVFIDVPTII